MGIEEAIRKAYRAAQARGWSNIYVMVDVHDTIASSTYKDDEVDFYPNAISALQELSKFPEVKLVLWTCCYPERYSYFTDRLSALGIKVAYINETPIKNTAYGDFRKKPYFSVVIDDKAGFDPNNWDDVIWAFKEARIKTPLTEEAALDEIGLYKKFYLEMKRAKLGSIEDNRLANECSGIWNRLSYAEREVLVEWMSEKAG